MTDYTDIVVLIVDDNPDDIDTFHRYLKQDPERSYKLLCCESGSEALKLFQEHQPDCVLLDFNLPDLDGLEFLSEVRGEADGKPPVVVMLTGEGSAQTAVEALKRGARDYLVKGSITPETLRLALISAMDDEALAKKYTERQRLVARMTILIVDDNPEHREQFRRLIRKSTSNKYDFIEAECGEEGLVFIRERKPDCVLLDYLMPDMDGLEFMEELQAQDASNDALRLPVIMLTGEGTEQIAVKAMQLGAEDYLVKSQLTSEQLLHSINIAVEKIALQRDLQRKQRELEEFHMLAVGREERIMELKIEVNEALELAGRPRKYELAAI